MSTLHKPSFSFPSQMHAEVKGRPSGRSQVSLRLGPPSLRLSNADSSYLPVENMTQFTVMLRNRHEAVVLTCLSRWVRAGRAGT